MKFRLSILVHNEYSGFTKHMPKTCHCISASTRILPIGGHAETVMRRFCVRLTNSVAFLFYFLKLICVLECG